MGWHHARHHRNRRARRQWLVVRHTTIPRERNQSLEPLARWWLGLGCCADSSEVAGTPFRAKQSHKPLLADESQAEGS